MQLLPMAILSKNELIQKAIPQADNVLRHRISRKKKNFSGVRSKPGTAKNEELLSKKINRGGLLETRFRKNPSGGTFFDTYESAMS